MGRGGYRVILGAASIGAALAAASASAAPPPRTDLGIVGERFRARNCATLPPAAEVKRRRGGLQADGRWPDIDYASAVGASWPGYAHVKRLRDLAIAYACPASPRLNDPSLRTAIGRAYDFWTARDPKSDNWWWNDIGAPELLAETMVLVEPMMSEGRREAGLTILKRAYRPRSSDQSNTGANRVWRAGVGIARGILTRDEALTDEAFRAIEDTIVVTQGEGVQIDQSFHQHGPQLQNMGYGLAYAEDSLKWSAVAAGTRYALQPRTLRIVTNYLLDGTQWMMRGGTAEPTARGREIVRAGAGDKSERMLAIVGDALALGSYRKAELERFAAELRASGERDQRDKPGALEGHRHFWRSDLTVHHGRGFYASVKISSPRTRQPEWGNGENVKGLHLADGLNLIMQSGREYAEIQPVWDWNRLPGTTTAQGAASLTPAAVWGVPGTSDFAVGVSDGGHGATGFHYDRDGVSARKAWFFLGGAIVALGAGVDGSASSGPVVTSVNQALLAGRVSYKLRSENAPRSIARGGTVTDATVDWVLHDGVSYLFLDPARRISLAARPQTGSWREINRTGAPEPVTRDVFSLSIDHGARPSGAGYAYMVAPGVDLAGVARLRASTPIRVIRNDAAVQAVGDRASNRQQIVFHASGSVALAAGLTLTSDRPAVVMLHRNGDTLDVSAAVPDAEPVTLQLRLTAPIVGAAIGKDGTATITIPMPGDELAGKTVTRRFALRVRGGK